MGKRANRKELKKYEKILGNRKVFEMTEEELYAPISKEIGELCRHRLEKRWYRRLIEINLIMIIAVIAFIAADFDKDKKIVSDYIIQCKDELLEDLSSFDSTEDATEEKTEATENSTSEDNIDVTENSTVEDNSAANVTTEVTTADETKKSSNEDKASSDNADKKKISSDDIPFEITLLLEGILALVIGYIGLYVYYAVYRANSLRITERNFPDVYRTIEEYAYRLGINTPKAYVMQSNGVLNAFSTFLFRRQWIVINSELFEVAYREYQDMDSLNFVIAHEMAHIYYGHSTLHYNLPIWFSMNIPVIGAIASRAREYSCDRLAQRLTGVDGIEAMLVLVVDRHLYKLVDKEDYINEQRQIKGFFVWAANMFVDHPIMSKRIVALEEGKGSGKLY